MFRQKRRELSDHKGFIKPITKKVDFQVFNEDCMAWLKPQDRIAPTVVKLQSVLKHMLN